MRKDVRVTATETSAGALGIQEAPASQVWSAMAIVYVVWGSTYLAIRYAIETLPPFLMASVRFLVAGGLLYVVVFGSGALAMDAGGSSRNA